MKKKLPKLLLLLLLFAAVCTLHAQVTVTINITPPYSTKLSDYASMPGKVIISLTNTSPTNSARVYLRAELTGDNGIKISTKQSFRPAQPIILPAGIPQMVDLQTLATLFDVNSFDLQGTTATKIFEQNGLPEGNYQFCVRAYNYDVPGLPLSSPNPFGCTNVRLTQLEPPLLIKPFDKDTIGITRGIQNVIFSWNIPAGSEPGTQYVLRIVEMLNPNRNPADIMNAKTTPAFYENTTSANIVLYGPAQPPFVEGRKYAWCVTALPGIQGTAYKNNGRSEVRSFVYTKPAPPPPSLPVRPPSPITLVYPANKSVVDSKQGMMNAIAYNTVQWNYDTSIHSSYEIPIIVEVKPGQTPEQALQSNPNIAGGKEPKKTVNVNLSPYDGKTLAWKVIVHDTKDKVYTSDVQTFSVSPPKVTLMYPADKEFVPDSKLAFQWTYSNSLDVKMGDAYSYPDQKPTIVVLKKGQTPKDAITNNANLFVGNSQGYNMTDLDMSTYSGKTLAWKVDVSRDGKTYTSEIDTFSVILFDKALKQNLTTFNLCGYPITVTSLYNIDGFNYKGTGTTQLYKNGPTLKISFEKLTIQPFGSTKDNSGKVTAYTNWKATTSMDSIALVDFKNQNINLTVNQKNIPGSFTFNVTNIHFNPFIISHWDGATSHFIDVAALANPNITDADYAPTISGKFKWVSEFLGKDDKGLQQMAAYMSNNEQTIKFDYNQQFAVGAVSGAMSLNGDVSAVLKFALQKNTEMVLSPYIKFNKGGLQGDFIMSGWYKVISLTDAKKTISIDFNATSDFEFDKTFDNAFTVSLNKDASCIASYKKLHLNLTSNPNKTFGLSIPELQVMVDDKSKDKHPSFTFLSVPVDGENGIKLSEVRNIAQADQNIKFYAFDLTLQKINCIIAKTELVQFKMDGAYTIPFVNQKATFSFMVDKNSVQNGSLAFVDVQTNTLYNDPSTGDKCTFKPTFAAMEFAKIALTGNFSFSNPSSGKHLNVSNIASPKFAITPDGSVSMYGVYSSEFDNTASNPAGDFNGFKFTPFKMNFGKYLNQPKYVLKVSGVMVLADNFSSKNSTNNFTTEVTFDANSITYGGASFNRKDFASFKEYHEYKKGLDNKQVSFSSKADASSDNESSSFTGANLTFYDNDNTYGTGFRAEIGYSLKSPVDPQNTADKSINATLWVGHKQQGYNYWFLEAGQKNFIVVPTGILDLAINGFKGRIFYHMRHDGNNINNSAYIPDNSKFLGVYAQVNLKTNTDNGIKFWGDLAMEVLTNNSGLESIKLLGNGTFISTGENTDGIIKAKDCKLDFYWSPKKVTGNFNAELNVASQIGVSANAGFAIGDGEFHLWGSGSGSLFGQQAPASCGFDLNKDRVELYGDFKMIDINWHNDGLICDDDILITSGVKIDATVAYSPFQLQAGAVVYGEAKVQECGETIFSLGLSLNGQLQFPSPTCVSAGVSVFGYDFDMGIRNGSIIFDKCF